MIFVYALGIWFGIVVIAVLNGVFRNAVIAPRLGDYLGHVVSSVILICIILIVTCIFISNLTIACTTADLLLIGLLWLVLTVSFEFLFGHYVAGHSWETLLADYNIFKGRLWLFVLMTVFIAPVLIGHIIQK